MILQTTWGLCQLGPVINALSRPSILKLRLSRFQSEKLVNFLCEAMLSLHDRGFELEVSGLPKFYGVGLFFRLYFQVLSSIGLTFFL